MLFRSVVIVVVAAVDAMGERRAAFGVMIRAAVAVAVLGLLTAASSSSGAEVLSSPADEGTFLFVSPACPAHDELARTLVVLLFCSRRGRLSVSVDLCSV